tara:strand:- start:139 stop:567 length:429 start_codon:yes stop_codon:yes gene_type:complete
MIIYRFERLEFLDGMYSSGAATSLLCSCIKNHHPSPMNDIGLVRGIHEYIGCAFKDLDSLTVKNNRVNNFFFSNKNFKFGFSSVKQMTDWVPKEIAKILFSDCDVGLFEYTINDEFVVDGDHQCLFDTDEIISKKQVLEYGY